MANFALKNIHPAADTDFSKGVYIILFNATNIPPHLLIAAEGKIYSITDSGRQLGSSLEKLIAFVKRKNVPTIITEWKVAHSWNVGDLENLIKEKFLKYERVIAGKVSCLFPIRDVVAAVLGDEMKKADFIFELLPLMEKVNTLGQSYSINMTKYIVAGNFELPTYSNKELISALRGWSTDDNDLTDKDE
ncbi:hypothetical protein BH09BAC5_BH09BAC5_02110 [soil metagenome]